MSGIDEIIARIDAEALASENVLRAEYDDKIKEITDPNIHNYPLQIINSLIITERS